MNITSLYIRIIRSAKRYLFNETILNTTKLGFSRSFVFNPIFNATENKNPLLYSNPVPQLQNHLEGIKNKASETITKPPGAHGLSDIADKINEKTDGNIIIEADKKRTKCLMDVSSSVTLDIENFIASSPGTKKQN